MQNRRLTTCLLARQTRRIGNEVFAIVNKQQHTTYLSQWSPEKKIKIEMNFCCYSPDILIIYVIQFHTIAFLSFTFDTVLHIYNTSWTIH